MFHRLSPALLVSQSKNTSILFKFCQFKCSIGRTAIYKNNLLAYSKRAEIKLADTALDQKTVILKMQPKMREQLLQGLKKVGPKGYRKFIRDYFRRLTKVKKSKK